MSAWFEDDTLWESLESFLFSQLRSSEMTVREAEQILTLLHPSQGAAVLDLCCGTGRHSLEFARHGFQVTGVDRTARYLDTARAAATREGLTVEFVQEDMRHFQRPAVFDVALNLFSSFGYFDDETENLWVLRHLHTSLNPGGQVLLEMAGKEPLARDFQPRTWHRARRTRRVPARTADRPGGLERNRKSLDLAARPTAEGIYLAYTPIFRGGTNGAPLQSGFLCGPALWESGRYPIRSYCATAHRRSHQIGMLSACGSIKLPSSPLPGKRFSMLSFSKSPKVNTAAEGLRAF